MANPLDWAARAILQINGMNPEDIKTKARQVKKQGPKKPMPKANTSAPQPAKKAPVTRKTRVNGRVKPGQVSRSNQAGQAKPVRQGPRTANVEQQVKIGPRSAQKPDGPIGPNSRYTPRSQQQPDGKAPSKTVRKLQEAAKTKPKSPAPKPAPKAGPGTSSRPLGTADVGPKGEVGRLGQRTGMKGNTPKPQLKAPNPGVKAPVPGSTQVKGQTNLFNAKGEPRDFRNPKVSAGRQPTTTPVSTRSSAQATPPNRPIGGSFGNQPKGQGYLNLGAGERTGIKDPWGPGTNPRPGQKPAAKPQAAKPKPPAAAKPPATQPPAPKPAAPRVSAGDAAAARAVRSVNLGRRLSVGRGGAAATVLGIANAIDNSRLTDSQRAKKSEVVDLDRGQKFLDKLKAGTLGQPTKAKPKADTSKSAKAATTSNYQRPKANVSKPSAAQQATDKRDKKKLF